MLFITNQKKFVDVLTKAKKIVKATKGALNVNDKSQKAKRSVKVEAIKGTEEDFIEITGSDFETEFCVNLPAEVYVQGIMICENSKLQKMAKKVKTNGNLRIEYLENSGDHRVKLSGKTVNLYVETSMEEEEYPDFIKHFNTKQTVENANKKDIFNSGKKYQKLFDKLKKFVNKDDDYKKHLEVVHLASGERTVMNNVEGCATNGHTLQVIDLQDLKWIGRKDLYNHLSIQQINFFFGLKPDKFTIIAGDNCGVTLYSDNCSVRFKMDTKYPPYKSVVDGSFDNDGAILTVNRKQLLNVLKTFYSLSRNDENITYWTVSPDTKEIKISFSVDGKIKADATVLTPEIAFKGNHEKEHSENSEFKVALNCNYIKDIVSNQDDDFICLFLNDKRNCNLIYSALDDFDNKKISNLNLLMPLNID